MQWGHPCVSPFERVYYEVSRMNENGHQLLPKVLLINSHDERCSHQTSSSLNLMGTYQID